MRVDEFLASPVSEIWKWFQNFKRMSRNPFPTAFNLFLPFFSLMLLAVYTLAKFEVFSFDHSRDMEGPKILKLRSVIPS